MRSNVVCLCSGGIDSMVMTSLLQDRGYEIRLLHINYGQVTFPAERDAAIYYANYLDVEPPISMDCSALSAWGSGSLVEGSAESEFFPHRNLFLLSCGAVVASKLNFDSLAIGVLDAQNAQFADCTPAFLRSVATTIGVDKPELHLLSPLENMSKAEVVALGLKLNSPLSFSFSCNRINHRHCWNCTSCQERKISFSKNSIDL